MILTKSHALGNDYLVLASGEPLRPDLVRRLCNRHTGVGADGVLEPMPSENADFGLRIWNPDGSQAEKSGNGLRIYARWLFDHRDAGRVHSIEVPAGVSLCRVDDRAVTVEMGRASFVPEEIPCKALLRATPVPIGGELIPLTAVGLGNPHCVIFVNEAPDDLPWREWGAIIERHELFPNRTNVQFARVLSRDIIEVRVWERGAGETSASGSSACAVAAAAVSLGKSGATPAVIMPGGTLSVTVDKLFALTLYGPVQEVCQIEVSPAWLGEDEQPDNGRSRVDQLS